MRSSRSLHRRLEKVAGLQGLKALASAAGLAEAQADRSRARDRLERCESALLAQAGRAEQLLSSCTFDLDAWRIGRIALDELAKAQDAAAQAAADAAEREAGEARKWRSDRELEKHAAQLCRKSARRLNEKKDTATSEEFAARRPLSRREIVR